MTEEKFLPAARARQVLVDRLGIITEQAPPYCPSAKGTVESLFRWMTQRFERRLPNTSHGMHDAEAATHLGAMTLEELERYFFRAIVDDYQQSWDGLRRQTRAVLWEEAVRQTGVPQYLGAPDDLKLRYDEGCQSQSEEPQISGPRWLTPLFSRPVVCVPRASQSPESAKTWNCIMTDAISGSFTSLLREHTWVKPTAQPLWDSGRVEWEAKAMRRADREKARTAAAASQEVRVRLQEEIEEAKKQRRRTTRALEQARQFDRQREEIHPPHVLSALAAMQEPAPSNLRLPEAKPDPDGEYPVHVLPIRPLVPEDN